MWILISLDKPTLFRVRWSSLRQIPLCCDQCLEEEMNFIINGSGLCDSARDLAAQGYRILLAQPVDQRVYCGFTDSKRCRCLLVGSQCLAFTGQKAFKEFEYLSFTARGML